ncbi:plasmid replication, integration and excision activator [Sphaerisporangium sp. TRM90804]|uniref:plasmid replication, integration and excision activator n=1 Tax=Sphaerisporangium sp. TRM90804 TaxID=3031113 RepID=UPI00244AEA29|nr:plasmid replication, integration and excision activator [Sphaerisporangium sp. TRM90804]MDH2426935.1 plasmid replication, integration and excision activator [Sphaerisporangium sp. TRM90804]
MALQGPIPVTFDMVFPHGCYVVGEVEKVKDFDASTNGRFGQARDKQSGELVWQVAVMDADPTLKPAQKTVAVKILASMQPVPPAPMAGLPFTPVEFDGMSVTPYVNANGRLAYSIRVREMRGLLPAAPKTNAPTSKENI